VKDGAKISVLRARIKRESVNIKVTDREKHLQAVFIDRDGTIGEIGIDFKPQNFSLFPGSNDAISLLKSRGVNIFAFTNQPDISDANLFEMVKQYEEWKFDQAYICPHTDELNCKCRKPLPGMLYKAAREHNLDLNNCAVIGDLWRDIIAADKANCIKILVKTGHGKEENNIKKLLDIKIDYIADDILDAVTWLIKNH
jgi:histidinol-phosphate phosphatase family protein